MLPRSSPLTCSCHPNEHDTTAEMFFSLLLLACITTLLLPASGEFISTASKAYNNGHLGHRPYHAFYSSAERAPVLQVNAWNQSAVAGGGSHIFMRNDGQNGSDAATPLVLAARDLSAVYMNRTFANVFGPRVQADRGKRYLTFWEGVKGDGIGEGNGLAYDENYRLRYVVKAGGLFHTDLHEFALTGDGTALVVGVDKKNVSTAGWEAWRGAEEWPILDAVFQEVDLETGEVLFSWRATDHIDPMDTYEQLKGDMDAYHLNSIQKVHTTPAQHCFPPLNASER